MNLRVILTSLFWSVLLSSHMPVYSQRMDIPQGFEHYTNTDGLSQGMINAILQDQRGFLWIGTKDGLDRYDGYEFKAFRENPFDTTSISGNYIETIFEDQYGILWIGTDEGLNRYDPRIGTFSRFRHRTEDLNSLSSDLVTVITEDPSAGAGQPQVLWVGTNAGLNQIQINAPQSDRPTYIISRVSSTKENELPFSNQGIVSLVVDNKKRLWLSTGEALFYTSDRYERGKNISFQQVPASAIPQGNSPYNQYYSFILDKSGILWIVSGKAISKVHQEDNTPIRFQVFRYPNDLELSRIGNAALDNTGKIWIINDELPPLTFDTQAQAFKTLGDSYSQFTDEFGCTQVYFDRSNNIWLGTNGFGLLKYNLKKDQFHTYTKRQVVGSPPKTSYVRGFLPSMEENKMLVYMNQWYQVDQQQEKLIPADLPSLYDQNLEWRPLADGKYFVNRLREKEYSIYDPEKGTYSLIRKAPAYRALATVPVMNSTTGLYFIEFQFANDQYKSEEGYYLLHWNAGTQTVSEFPLTALSDPLLSRTFERGIIDRKGWLWFPNRDGLLRYDPGTNSLKVYQHDVSDPNSISSNYIKSVLLDPVFPERFLWVGTNSGGLNRLDLQSEQFIHYTESDGLPNSVIYGILPDKAGHLWVSTNQGLSQVRLNEKREAIFFQNYNRDDGLPGDEFNTDAYYKTKSGELYFGGVDGLVWFHPDSLSSGQNPPQLVITDFQIDYQSVSFRDPGSPLSRPISETNEIVLQHKQDAFAFEFAALDYSASSKNRYAFFLENFDEDWNDAGTNRRVVYTNVPPGTYWLRAKASTGEGNWNEEEVKVKIIIRPPWWQTWWAYLSFTALFIGLLIIIRQSELNRRKLKNEAAIERARAEEQHRQAEKVEAQSRELAAAVDKLKQKNEEIIATQQKLIVQDRLATLGQLIAGIAHEIKNPLNFVNNFSDISAEMAEELREELEPYRDQIKAEDFDAIQQLIEYIKQNTSRVQESGQRAISIINNLMDLSRGTQDSFRPANLHALLDENIKLAYHGYRALVPDFNVDIQKDYASELPPVEMIPPDIGRVLLNILNNACYAVHQKKQQSTEEYEPILKVSTQLSEENVQIFIRDNGPGLPPDVREKIFTAFFTTKPSGEGNTGLGLSISQDIIHKHGGSIEVDSEPGKYTEFVLTLPFKQTKI